MGEADEQVLAESENYIIWTSTMEGETLTHVELGGVSLHLTSEEWDEFLTLVKLVLG